MTRIRPVKTEFKPTHLNDLRKESMNDAETKEKCEEKMEKRTYVGECLKPFCFGLFAYRFKWKDKNTHGYYGYGHHYGYGKLVGNLFVKKRYIR